MVVSNRNLLFQGGYSPGKSDKLFFKDLNSEAVMVGIRRQGYRGFFFGSLGGGTKGRGWINWGTLRIPFGKIGSKGC